MKRLNDSKISMVLFVFAAAIVLGGGSANADFTFGEPVNLGPVVNSPGSESAPSISADGLSLYFISDRPGGRGGGDIWVTTRSSVDDPWGPPVNLGATVNSASDDYNASISTDGLSLYFSSNRSGGYAIWVTTRASVDAPWGPPVNLGPTVNSTAFDMCPSISADGLSLYFASYNRTGGSGRGDLWVTRRATLSDPWGPPANLGSTVNSPGSDRFPSISPDGLVLFFDRGPASGVGPDDIWVTRRATVSDPWGLPVNLGPRVNSPSNDGASNVSADGRTLYFTSNRPLGSSDIWQASIIPIVDLNGDEIVDNNDLVILNENWGTDSDLCDIGPMPWGDGVVDENDLEVLMSYWGQEFHLVNWQTLAYWRLDEAQGSTAQDSAVDYDGTLHGEPVWQPEGGKVNGALQLDGINDYMSTPFVLNPASGSFSIFVWVKGSAVGKVIISQKNGANWLLSDSGGKLMTELRATSRSLVSQTVITDGQWHRVCLSWDGSNRILYVDDVEVAKDTQAWLLSSTGGLYIGSGKTLSSGTFWSGLIDDVRIYDRAVTP